MRDSYDFSESVKSPYADKLGKQFTSHIDKAESDPIKAAEVATKVAIASDHAGFEYKEAIKANLKSKGISVEDFGTDSTEPVDYPRFIRAAARAVANGQCNLGIVLGGSGNEAIVANRIVGIRCAVVWNNRTALLSKEHGDCNMISIGQRMMTCEEAVSIVNVWLNAEFKGGRHQRRIDQIDE